MPPLSPASLRSASRKSRHLAFGVRLLVTGMLVLPLAACDGSPSKADLKKVVADQARSQNPLMRNFSDDIVLKGAEITDKTCQAMSSGAYQCSMTVDVMGQPRTLSGVFTKRNGVWSEVGVM